ncbi:MAG: hypothetical protein J3Q66DRAFT_441097 [Benniella sp.]|nr:MAG: hypothetical protein J3Q66DRAFT_441097 [Benniella sp.]
MSSTRRGRSADSALPRLSLPSSISTLSPASPPLTSNESHAPISVAPDIVHDKCIRQRSRNESASTPPPSPPLSATEDRYPQVEETNSTPYHHESRESVPYTSQEMDIAYSMVHSIQQQPESPQDQHRYDRTQSKPSPIPRAASDVLSTLLKTGPTQEPYFRTKHTIASQHTLSTTRGVLFSLDEEPHEFNKDMYVAMRNRIFELEAKAANYTPFNHSRKRVAEWLMDENYPYHEHSYGPAFVHGYDAKAIRYPKRAHCNDAYLQHHPSPAHLHPPISTEKKIPYRYPRSYPSWYTPETNTFESYHQLYRTQQHPSSMFDRERVQQRPGHSQADSHPGHDLHPRMFAPADSTGARPALPVKRSLTMIKPRPSFLEITSSRPEPSCPKAPQALQLCTGSELPATAITQQQQQSFHQRQHRAQQQAQSDYSRKYHLQKHLRMLDQQRAAQIALQQQQQQQHHHHQQQQQQSFRIQRQYESHQQMCPASSKSQELEIQQPEDTTSIAHRTTHQMVQRHQQQSIPQRTVDCSTMGNGSQRVSTILPSRMFVRDLSRDKPSHQKSERPLECSNCMTLEPFQSAPPSDLQLVTSSKPALVASDRDNIHTAANTSTATGGLLCPPCMQYLQNHGKVRPPLPFKVNFLKKIHCRLKRELREVRFHGWQDAQTLEIEDQMTEENFQTVFHAGVGKKSVRQGLSIGGQTNSSGTSTLPQVSTSKPDGPEVISIDDGDDDKMANESSGQSSIEKVRFSSESSVEGLFGPWWKSEPMVGYTAVCFGGSDKIRMVPMNPTISALNVTFNKNSRTVVFAFRVLVNGLCLLSSGGGPPALHMPETIEDEEPEGDQGVSMSIAPAKYSPGDQAK